MTMKRELLADLMYARLNLTADLVNNFYDVGLAIYETRSTKKKLELLKSLLVMGELQEHYRALFRLMMCDFYKYGVSSDVLLNDSLLDGYDEKPIFTEREITKETIDRLFSLFGNWMTGEYNKSTFCELMTDELNKNANTALIDLILCILDKDWGVNVTSTTINKLDEEQTIVPVFNNTRATDIAIDELENLEGEEFYIETKYDGTRDYLVVPYDPSISDIYCLSRNGRPLKVPELNQDIWSYIELQRHLGYSTLGGFVIDGELTIKDSIKSDDRGAITGIHNSAIALGAGKNSSLEDGWSEGVTFNAFDIIEYETFFNGYETSTLALRKSELIQLLNDTPKTDCIKLGEYITATKDELMEKARTAFKDILSIGGEGLIVKDTDYTYSFDKAHSGWYKLKPTFTCSLRVTGVQTSEDPELPGALGALICATEDGLLTVEVGSGFRYNDRGYLKIEEYNYNPDTLLDELSICYEPVEGYDINNWIGKIVEVKYFGVTHTKEKDNNSLFLPRVATSQEREKYNTVPGELCKGIVRTDKTEAYYVTELVGYRK